MAAASALVALGLAVASLWATGGGRLLEPWHLSRLDAVEREVRVDAARRLAAMGSRRALDRLLAPMRRGEPDRGLRRSEMLAAMGAFAVPGLVEVLEGDDVFASLQVLRSLEAMGPSAESAIRALVAVRHEYLISGATDTLAAIGEPAVPGLVQMLDDERMIVRHFAARALGKVRPAVARAAWERTAGAAPDATGGGVPAPLAD